jgi:hypothetical protein
MAYLKVLPQHLPKWTKGEEIYFCYLLNKNQMQYHQANLSCNRPPHI